MPRCLVAVPACHQDDWAGCEDWAAYHQLNERASSRERIQAIRETWWKDCALDKKFFFGAPAIWYPPADDEVITNVHDGLMNLCFKVQAMCKWALDHGYDYMFRVDDDAYVFAERLEQASRTLYADQVGFCPDMRFPDNYITGGAGYWLSARAMDIIRRAPAPQNWAEDLWVGSLLRKDSVRLVSDDRYLPAGEKHWADLDNIPADVISLHACTPEMMRTLDRRPHALA